jgi:hypothetical protein
MRDDGMLVGKDWMHFLGTAQLDWACYLTLIQRQIRKHINENFTISFDCASPFIATAHGLVYTNPQFAPKRWSTIMEKATDNKHLSDSTIPFPWESEIGSRLTMGDICYYDPGVPKDPSMITGPRGGQVEFDATNPDHYEVLPTRKNKLGKYPNKTSWDSFSYALMMAHNVNSHISSVQRANHLMDIECTRFNPDWRLWGVEGKKEKELSDWVPKRILYFNRFIEELFNTKTKEEAFQMIDDGIGFLRSLEGTRSQDGKAKNMYFQLFEDSAKDGNDLDLSNPDDDNLRELEEDIDNE